MPLDEDYGPQIYSSNADLCNVRHYSACCGSLGHLTCLLQSGGKYGGACTAALFLKAFVNGIEPKEGEGRPSVQWAYLDIADSIEVRGDLTL